LALELNVLSENGMDTPIKKSTLGMDENTAAGLLVLLAVIGFGIVALILIFVEKESKFVKFHCIQAVALLVVMALCYVVGTILMIIVIGFIFYFVAIVPWIFLIIQCIKAFQNEEYKVPLIGEICANWAGGTR
jgi:uncharacterized membrane protein